MPADVTCTVFLSQRVDKMTSNHTCHSSQNDPGLVLRSLHFLFFTFFTSFYLFFLLFYFFFFLLLFLLFTLHPLPLTFSFSFLTFSIFKICFYVFTVVFFKYFTLDITPPQPATAAWKPTDQRGLISSAQRPRLATTRRADFPTFLIRRWISHPFSSSTNSVPSLQSQVTRPTTFHNQLGHVTLGFFLPARTQ